MKYLKKLNYKSKPEFEPKRQNRLKLWNFIWTKNINKFSKSDILKFFKNCNFLFMLFLTENDILFSLTQIKYRVIFWITILCRNGSKQKSSFKINKKKQLKRALKCCEK